ncbi:hypothetical protein D5F01_LYC23556 [Larimichthys crocea]|uniref:Uncharacterized protein n=1 Tax=Larimichthys crocea TaxID=215358 RepID=A0A6G0HHC6_LARCR|nr:hypothetical protein D5F01_LYC23556 [Larimichthys crocea]
MATEPACVVGRRMDSLTESEMAQVARQQREAGVQRLSCHFSWPEFCDERRCFHQEFVYDVAMFATACGFPWPDVIRAAVIAKGIFPQLDDLNVPKILSLLRDTCITQRQRLFHAVVGGAANISIAQLHLEVQLPPTPCPLAQGTDLHEWEHQRHQAELTSKLLQKEEELKVLRAGSRITLGAVDVPEDEQLDKEGVSALVRAAVKATEDQMRASLTREASLISDLLQLKLQQAALATGRLQDHSSSSAGSHADSSGKTKTGRRRSGNAE